MEVSDFTTYLVLAYLAHTAARVSTGLLPAGRARQSAQLRGWLSTGFGVGLAFATGVDLLADLGLSVAWPPLGVLVTGVLMGQGAKFGVDLLRGARGAAAGGTSAPPGDTGAPPSQGAGTRAA